jgi:esterase/lipase
MSDNLIQERVENLTGGSNVSADLPIAVDIPLAVLSKAAYENYETNDKKETQKMIDDYNIGYTVVEDLTEPEYVTAVNEEQQKIVVAFRGTDASLTNIYDDIADLEIAAGLAETPILSYVPSRFKTGENIYKQVKEQYPDYELNLTGHSLGGTVARYIGDKYEEKAVVFSPGATPLEPFIEKTLGTKPSTAKFYVTDTLDFLSNTVRLTEKNVNIIKTKEVNKKYFTGSHSVDNYLPKINEKINPINNKLYPQSKIQKATKTEFNENKTKLNYKQIKEKINPIINKMYPQKETQKATKTIFNENPFRRSICEERPELCYD